MSARILTNTTPIKRRRGGQPGNQNAKNNRGNPRPLRNTSAMRGGAPLGNQNARKKITLAVELLREYAGEAEARAWIEANRTALESIGVQGTEQRDRALYDGSRGLTPEALCASGREYALGLYVCHPADAGGM